MTYGFRRLLVLVLLPLFTAPLLADRLPAPTTSPTMHAFDPCAVISQQDVASAAGVAVNQVFTPRQPTATECVWAIGNKAGTPGQQIAYTVQTVGAVQQAHGMARFGSILGAVQGIPGVPLPQSALVQRAFADAQVIVGLGDRAGWKNGTLSVLKNETLFQVNATGQSTDSDSLAVCKSVAESALTNLNTKSP